MKTFDQFLDELREEVRQAFPYPGCTILDVDLRPATRAVNLWIIMRILRALWERK